MTHRRSLPRRRLRDPLTVCVVVAIAAATIGGIGVWNARAPTITTTDMRGRPVQLDPSETPIPGSVSHAVNDTGERLVVPSVQLDVPLGRLDEVHGQITPPGFTSAYLVRNLGVAPDRAADGTVYVVMHSLRNGAVGPGNYITDVAHQRSKLHDGQSIIIAGVHYTVTGSTLINKSRISNQRRVWSNIPNRLQLITCLEHPDGTPSTQNLVVTATH